MTIEESKIKLDDANYQALKNALEMQSREISIKSDNLKYLNGDKNDNS